MPNDQLKKIPQLNRITNLTEMTKVVNTVIRVLNDHVDGMLVIAKTMSRLTDMVEKHNKRLIELSKRVMPFEENSNNESILPPH